MGQIERYDADRVKLGAVFEAVRAQHKHPQKGGRYVGKVMEQDAGIAKNKKVTSSHKPRHFDVRGWIRLTFRPKNLMSRSPRAA